jgi:hypothetical protein
MYCTLGFAMLQNRTKEFHLAPTRRDACGSRKPCHLKIQKVLCDSSAVSADHTDVGYTLWTLSANSMPTRKASQNYGTLRILPDHSKRRNLRDWRNRKNAHGIGVMGCAERTQRRVGRDAKMRRTNPTAAGSRGENATDEPNGMKIESQERDERTQQPPMSTVEQNSTKRTQHREILD